MATDTCAIDNSCPGYCDSWEYRSCPPWVSLTLSPILNLTSIFYWISCNPLYQACKADLRDLSFSNSCLNNCLNLSNSINGAFCLCFNSDSWCSDCRFLASSLPYFCLMASSGNRSSAKVSSRFSRHTQWFLPVANSLAADWLAAAFHISVSIVANRALKACLSRWPVLLVNFSYW